MLPCVFAKFSLIGLTREELTGAGTDTDGAFKREGIYVQRLQNDLMDLEARD